MTLRVYIGLFILITPLLTACGSSPYRYLKENEIIESRYVTYVAPDATWEVNKRRSTDHWSSGINAWLKGVKYDLTVQGYPFTDEGHPQYFDKDAEYIQILKDEDMNLGKIAKEQGIGYSRNWTAYVKGMRCSEGVYSRNGGGLMASISSKNYGIACGYYHKTEGRRWLDISYRYNYAAGPVRHQHDKNTPREEFLTLEQAEMNLKLAVKKVVESLHIKDVDWERMEREGLLHPDEEYTISIY